MSSVIKRSFFISAILSLFILGTLSSSWAQIAFNDSGQSLGAGNSSTNKLYLADLDGDGDLDAIGANWGSGNPVWLNDGNGFFSNNQLLGSLNTFEVRMGDLDGDGDLDAITSRDQALTQIWFNNGNGFFVLSGNDLGTNRSTGLGLGDFDNDGDLDIFQADWDLPDRVWLNDGAGNFTNTGQSLGGRHSRPVVIGDLDNDGDLDAVVGVLQAPNQVWLNNGSGQFTNSGQGLGINDSTVQIALGDLDGDGDLDIVEVSEFDPHQVWINDGSANFSNTQSLGTNENSWGVDLGDLDNDGDLDIFVANNNAPEQIFINNGSGTFINSGLTLGSASSSSGVALGDLNGDGDLDAFLILFGQPNRVLFNASSADATPPVITVPPDLIQEATGTATPVNIGQATATDDVSAPGNIAISNNAPASFPLGLTVVTWTATDEAGNSASATQNITVQDTTDPIVTAPADVTAASTGALTPVDIGTATATDAVGVVSITNDAPIGGFPVGATTVTWTATDSSGNSGTDTQTITVTAAPVDTTAPIITAPNDISAEATGTTTSVNIGQATAADDVSAPGNIAISNDAPASFPLGLTVVTWTATDEAGNSASATQNITVQDTTDPIVTAPADVTAASTGALTPVDIGTATATDAVGVVSITNDAPAGGFPAGTTTVTWTATDSSGNTGTAAQNVTITTAPNPTLEVDVNTARVFLVDSRTNSDRIHISGHLANISGLNLSEAVVEVDGFEISNVKVTKNGKFSARGRKLDLSGIDFNDPATVAVTIGNASGTQQVLFNIK